MDARGRRLSFARAAIRNLVFWFGLLLFFATFFSIVFGHRSRGLHDRASGAFVVRRRAVDALHAAAGHAPPRGPGRLRALAGIAFLVALAFGLNVWASGLLAGFPSEVARERVGPAGATIRVAKPGDPLEGLALVVPPGAYAAEREIVVWEQPILLHRLGDAVRPVSPLIEVEVGEGYADRVLAVRVPVALGADEFAMGFF